MSKHGCGPVWPLIFSDSAAVALNSSLYVVYIRLNLLVMVSYD